MAASMDSDRFAMGSIENGVSRRLGPPHDQVCSASTDEMVEWRPFWRNIDSFGRSKSSYCVSSLDGRFIGM